MKPPSGIFQRYRPRHMYASGLGRLGSWPAATGHQLGKRVDSDGLAEGTSTLYPHVHNEAGSFSQCSDESQHARHSGGSLEAQDSAERLYGRDSCASFRGSAKFECVGRPAGRLQAMDIATS